MTRGYQQLRIVLLQIRDHRESLLQERRCFIERSRLREEAFRFINLVDQPELRFSEVEDADAVIIGGSGSFSVTQEHSFTPWLREVVMELIERSRTLLGSCWGHQFMAKCGGGEVVTDPARSEVGSFEIHLNEGGLQEALFEGFPPVFMAQLGHNDRVSRLGEGWVELASSGLCDNQVIRVENRPVFSTQFHPELDRRALRERLAVYVQEYLPKPESREKLLKGLKASPKADRLLERFLRLYALV